jgi:hypothetical protein
MDPTIRLLAVACVMWSESTTLAVTSTSHSTVSPSAIARVIRNRLEEGARQRSVSRRLPCT